VLGAVLFAAACGGTPVPTAAPSDGGAQATDPSTSTADPGATGTPTSMPATPEPATAPPDTPAPSVDPSASPSSDPGAAAACAGSDDNREFFASIADVVSWPVYCPVLPSGWFVETGTYRLAGGGWLEIAYRGPGGARLEFREGTACADAGCLPSGEALGGAAFGDLAGTVSRLDDARLAVVSGPADGATWIVIGSGLDQDAFVAIAADLARVGD
jgi:hypothetical protein